MSSDRELGIESLLRTAAGFPPEAVATAEDLVARRVALYAEFTRRAPAVPGAKGRLLVADAAGGVRAFAVGEPPLEIGREAACALRLDDPEVSRRHCRVWADARGAWLEDLGSANGTFVNDRSGASLAALRDGDVIRVGRALIIFSGR